MKEKILGVCSIRRGVGNAIQTAGPIWKDQEGYRTNSAEIIEAEVCPDQIHIPISIPPKYGASRVMGYSKGKAA